MCPSWPSLVLLAACSNEPSSNDAIDAGNAIDAGDVIDAGDAASAGEAGSALSVSALVGDFQLNLNEANESLGTAASSALIGRVYDKTPPSATVLRTDRAQDGCELRIPANPFCPMRCTPAVCTADNQCTPLAIPQNVGTVRVHGLGVGALTMTATAPSHTYQPSAADRLPYPPCAEGAEVKLEGDAFSLQTRCIAPLMVGASEPLPVRAGEPVRVRWSPPGEASIARVHIKLDIAHHGGKKGEIVCDVPDTGTFDIPEPLVTRLVGLGVAGFPTIVLSREASTAASNAPNLKLTLTSSVERPVDTGVRSCTENPDCPMGTTCQDDLTCK